MLKKFRTVVGWDEDRPCNFVIVLVENNTGDIVTAYPLRSGYIQKCIVQ
jgi:hypothetical protein